MNRIVGLVELRLEFLAHSPQLRQTTSISWVALQGGGALVESALASVVPPWANVLLAYRPIYPGGWIKIGSRVVLPTAESAGDRAGWGNASNSRRVGGVG